jgi:hypothetical protein
MLLSASRRTDIPAFYAPWFVHRLKEGFFLVPNPRNPQSISKIPCSSQTVDCIVFWSKNPAPLLPLLEQIDALGYKYYLQFTLTPYGKELEKNLPEKTKLLDTFAQFGARLGPERMVWRYDPIICGERLDAIWHAKHFARLASLLSGQSHKCVISFLDFYNKIEKNMHMLHIRESNLAERRALVRELADISREKGFSLQTCAEEVSFADLGVRPSSCIDGGIIEKLTGRAAMEGKDPYQRPCCACLASLDIGMYDSCAHGCAYCYANANNGLAAGNAAKHNARGLLIYGDPPPGAAIHEKPLLEQGRLF